MSTLRNPVFPTNLKRRRVIGLDDETEDESDDEKRRKSSSRRNADDEYFYDARDYFNPEKYREIVAYRNKKHQRRECYKKRRFSGYVGDPIYMPDVGTNNCHDDSLQYRELHDYASEELEADAEDETDEIKLLTMGSTSESVVENTNKVGAHSNRKRKRHKSKDTCTESQRKTHRKKLKHRQDKLTRTPKDNDKKHGKCKKETIHHIKKSRHKKKKSKKQKKSTYNSDTESGELNQLEIEDEGNLNKFRSDCLGSASGSYFGNEDSGSSIQHSLCDNSSLSNHRLGEADCNFKAEQFVNRSEVSYDGGSSLVSAKYLNDLYSRTRHNSDEGGSSLVSDKYLNELYFRTRHNSDEGGRSLVSKKYLSELYFRTRHNSDSGESSIHSVDSLNYKQIIHCSDVVLDNASDHSESYIYCNDYETK